MDPRAPVLVGLGEATRRPGDEPPSEPMALAAEAVREALSDSGANADGVLARVQAIGGVPSAAWADGDPGGRVAQLLGLAPSVATLRSSMQGGNGPQLLVNVLAHRIAEGDLDCAVVCGAEALSTLARHLKAGTQPDWPAALERPADEVLEPDREASTEAERAVDLMAPIMAYPLIENAIRHASGATPAAHLGRISALWSRFSRTAATQPAAWSHATYTPEEIAAPSAANRQVTLPYTKLLNSNIQVDQGAAVIVASAEAARALGVPRDRWVFLHAGARATDEWFVSERRELHRSPAIRACGEAAFAHAGIGPEDLGPVDLYSCFPSAVQLAAHELGLPLDDPARPLTATGGLTFFGGPGNDYATHGIVAVARALREAPTGTTGLSTALGWYATKHALGLYGNAPPRRAFAAFDAEPSPVAPRTVAPPHDAEALAETCTLVFDRDGTPSYGILFALLPDGRRALAKVDDAPTMAAMARDDFLGSRVALRADRSFTC